MYKLGGLGILGLNIVQIIEDCGDRSTLDVIDIGQ